jgi:hypothetical protein
MLMLIEKHSCNLSVLARLRNSRLLFANVTADQPGTQSIIRVALEGLTRPKSTTDQLV